ncbi:hypothetical protein KUV24_23425 [Nitratireductor sp. DP7N14-4]|nr:hypothetical protein [Nitratireductor sp. DP7N14-4]
MSFVIFIILLLMIAGIFFGKINRWLSLLLLAPMLVLFGFASYVLFNMWYETTPESLNFSVQHEESEYIIENSWEKPLDVYRFPTDFVVFYVPNTSTVTNVKRERVKDYKEMAELEDSVKGWVEEKYPSNLTTQVFDIKASKNGRFTFSLPQGIKEKEVEVYYVHLRSEPMDTIEFWIKEIEIKP